LSSKRNGWFDVKLQVVVELSQLNISPLVIHQRKLGERKISCSDEKV
jgi:hypothetical protein